MTGHFRFSAAPVLLLVNGLAAALLYFTLRWSGVTVDFVVVGAVLIGAVLGMFWRVYVLVLTSIMIVAVAAVMRVVNDNSGIYAITLNVLVVHVAHQFGYLFGVSSLSNFLLRNVEGQGAHIGEQKSADRANAPASAHLRSLDFQPKIDEAKNAAHGLARVERPTSPISLTPSGELLNAIESLARAVSTEAILQTIRTSARRLIGSDRGGVIL